ncbi:MAG: hypothetical protein IJF54_00470 [Clostridia bacterium]|nr:hypothetical protein [Clostridia bacterium]
MKKYVFFTGTVSRMGGGQMYTCNKQKFVADLGYTPYVFQIKSGEMYISGFDMDKVFKHECIWINPYLYSKKRIDKILSKMLEHIDYREDDEIIIESHSPQVALWGELLAEKCKAKHFTFIIAENCPVELNYIGFLNFKLQRGELAGNSDTTVARAFEGYQEIEDSAKYRLSPLCNNVVEDVTNPLIDSIDDNVLTIASIGRLDKSYCSSLLQEFLKFAKEHENTKIQFVFVGGAPKKSTVKRFSDAFKNQTNVKCLVTGFIYPIPRAVFDKVDVFVSAAGSANVSWKHDVPTISLDVSDSLPIGVLGYTTTKTLYRNIEAEHSVSELLHKIVFENYLDDMPYQTYYSVRTEQNYFQKHMEFIEKSTEQKEYYPVAAITPNKKEKILKVLLGVLHTKLFLIVREMIGKFIVKMKKCR